MPRARSHRSQPRPWTATRVRAGDLAETSATLRVVGTSAAGAGYHGVVGPGEAVRIFTGAPVPEGADAVLIQEDADAADTTVTARAPVAAGKNIRAAGLDFREGDTLLPAGRRFALREIALAGAGGHGTVSVRHTPSVALISTGDELVMPGTVPGRDQIVASTAPGIAAYAATLGGAPHDLGIVPDDVEAIGIAIDAAMAIPADILVTLGGASVGEHDLVSNALEAKGMVLDFWRIAMRPGKPLLFGRIGETRVLGFPGNPVSSVVCAILFLRPLLAALLGRPIADPTEPAILGADVAANDSRQDYVRAKLTEGRAEPVVTPLPVQDSSMLSVLAEADCLLVRPPNAPAEKAGAPCKIVRLP